MNIRGVVVVLWWLEVVMEVRDEDWRLLGRKKVVEESLLEMRKWEGKIW